MIRKNMQIIVLFLLLIAGFLLLLLAGSGNIDNDSPDWHGDTTSSPEIKFPAPSSGNVDGVVAPFESIKSTR